MSKAFIGLVGGGAFLTAATFGGGGGGAPIHKPAIPSILEEPRSPATFPGFVNWENHPVHPLEITPDGTRLLVTNLPDDRLEVFDISGQSPVHLGSVPVGIDPVSVRAVSDTEAWVVNTISDNVSIVDLGAMNTVRTIAAADEPFDVVFAAGRAFVSCSQQNLVLVFDMDDLSAPPQQIEIDGESPRAMTLSADGQKVLVAILESGNASTVLGGGIDENLNVIAFPPNVVSDPAGPYGGLNPPPNDGNMFEPPIAQGNNPPLKVGLIVRKDDQGQWMDDNGGDWTALVSGDQAAKSGRPIGWDMPDRDVAIIDVDTLSRTYANRLMTLDMAIAVNPATGLATVVGTEATNEIRFEPNISGTFVRVLMATFDPDAPGSRTIVDLNPHLTYQSSTIPQQERDKSIGDPRGIVWNAAGTKGYVTGMGSDNIIVINPAGQRIGKAQTIQVGQGPIGACLDEARSRLYVFNRFEGTVSIVNTTSELEVARLDLHDPTPPVINLGRRHLYDTRRTSGLGQASCASCHVDARTDRLGWDLGDPQGLRKTAANTNKGAGITGLKPGQTFPPFEANFHPMKGPMTTQTLQGIIGMEPLHWRGDRDGIEEFNGAFMSLLGDDQLLSPEEMQEFEDLLASITFPPNPYRTIDNTLPVSLPLPGHWTTGRHGPAGQPLPDGNAQNGLSLYRSLVRPLDQGVFACVTCHTLPTGAGTDMTFTGGKFIPLDPGPLGERHLMLVSVDGSTNRNIKVPHLRNEYLKTGFTLQQTSSRAGFGVLHDGSIDSLERFIDEPAFDINTDQETADLVALLLAFSGSELPDGNPNNQFLAPGPPSLDSHAAVGRQVTIADGDNVPPEQAEVINKLTGLAQNLKIGLVVKGLVGDQQRGWVFQAGVFQSDREDETLSPAALLALAAPGSELTYTAVPIGTEIRRGVDRDGDGFFDRDELDRCADPADPENFPGGPGNADCDLSGTLDLFDFLCFVNQFNAGDTNADCDGSGALDLFDFLCFVNAFNQGC
jgi:DNA-binding beta-propeller fold protein YncE